MATVEINDIEPRVQYDVGATATTGPFEVPFPFFKEADVRVKKTENDVDTELVLDTDYSFSSKTAKDDGFQDGEITLSASVSDITLTIYRQIKIERTTDFPQQGPFNIAALNTVIDRLFAIAQEHDLRLDRSFSLTITSSGVAVEIPPVDDGKAFKWGNGQLTNTVYKVDELVPLAQEWAVKDEDSLISADAGGDGSTDYSALHHAAKASYHVVTARRYANEAENTTVVNRLTGADTGSYSALHHAVKAAVSANAAATSETNAATSETNAQTSATDASEHKTTAQRWANEATDTTVVDVDTGTDTGKYSAKHWAEKAQATVTGDLVYQGGWDASTGSFPASPELGDFYKVTVKGTVDSKLYRPGDQILYNGGDATLASGWDHLDNTEPSWRAIAADETVDPGDKLLVDTSTASVIVTLSAVPKMGDSYTLADLADSWATNNLTVDGNGNNIEGAATFTADVDGGDFIAVYDGTQWRVYA